jgi:hypothetical protein
MTIEIREASGTAIAKTGKRWLVVAATPGQGSSGYYSADVLREYGPKVFGPGTRAWLDHDPSRKLTDLVGTYDEGAYWNEESQRLEAVLTPATEAWSKFLDELGDKARASIFASGEKDDQDNVIALHPTRNASIDLVGYEGLVGSGVMHELYENARGSVLLEEKPGGTSPQEKERNEMEIEKLAERIDALTASLVSVQERAAEQNQATVDAEALEAAKISAIESFDSARKLIDAAEGLLPVQREALFESAKRGEDVAPLIEREKTVAEQAKAAVLSESAEDGARSFGSVASASDLGKVLG